MWPKLSRNQRRFVVAMQECATKKEAAEAIGLEPDTVYRWPGIVDEAINALSSDVEAAVWDILQSSAAKAAMVKVAGLDENDDRLRQAVASEILDRFLGKPTQRHEITHTWQDDVIDLLQRGEIDPDEVRAAYPDLATELFTKAGIRVGD